MNSRLRELVRQCVPADTLHFYSCPQGGKGSAPPAPDYTGAANAQSAASQSIATQQTHANRPNQYTPWGATTWQTSAGRDPATGQAITNWTQQQTLNPQLQQALDSQLGIQQGRSDVAAQGIDRVRSDLAQPFDWQNLPGMMSGPQAQLTSGYNLNTSAPQQQQTGTYGLNTSAPQQTTQTTNEPAFAQERQRIEQGLFDRMRPEHDYQSERERTRLMNQGLTEGSEAYDRAMQTLDERQAGERWNALNMGGQEQQRLQQMLMGQQQQAFGQDVTSQQAQNTAFNQQFQQDLSANNQNFNQSLAAQQAQNAALNQQVNQDLSVNSQNFNQQNSEAEFANRLRQQAIAEQAQARGMSLNEMNALLTGQQVGTPQMPSFMGASAGQAPNLLGAATAQGNYGMNAAQMQNQADAGLWGGLGQLAGTGAMLFAMSDVRLKTDLRFIGMHKVGVPVYDYTIFGRRERGVLAQDLLEVAPHLVAKHWSGYYMVNYGGLQ